MWETFILSGEMKAMKSTGIVRKVDSLGRIVLPIELRRVMGIDIKDPIEIFVDDSHIVLGKYQPACIFCDSVSGVTEFKGAKICGECMAKIKN
jgi:transcriptional pleiotropic regulator of transition state genes